MNSRLDLIDLNPQRMKRLKTLTRLLAKSKLFREADVSVIHNLSQYTCGHDYLFESLEGGKRGFIKSRVGGRFQFGDYLILQNGARSLRYQIQDIEHYPDSPHHWIAWLKLCDGSATNQPFCVESRVNSCKPLPTA